MQSSLARPVRRALLRVPVTIAGLSAVAAFYTPASAQEPFAIPRVSGPIVLDGRVDEPAWDAIPPLPVVTHLPDFGLEPSERTEIRLAHDDDYLYLSCRAYDSDPAGIQAPSLQRDDGSWTNDWCVVNLDTFDDNETTLVFGTSPAGIRTDVVFPNDAIGPGNDSWNTFWDAASSRTDEGWFAEIRIPFTSLRFREGGPDEPIVLGVAVWRLIARKNEVIQFPAIPPQWPRAWAKASQFQQAVLPRIESRRPLYVTPYALGGTSRAQLLDPTGAAYVPNDERVAEVGVDLKYGLASNLTLDVTANPDFAQVEADDQQVNLTRYSLFFPEKRPFFLERAAVFEFPLGNSERLFHSRRIGVVGGELIPIHGGARVVGRMGGWDVGLLDMQAAETPATPGENMGLLRLRRQTFNENSYVGGILTTRAPGGGAESNVLYGLDGVVRLFGQDYLTAVWSQSFGQERDPEREGPLDRSLARLFWERRGEVGLAYHLDVSRVGASYEPGLGFLRRRDYSRAEPRLAFGWRPGPASRLLHHVLALEGSVFRRDGDRVVESAEFKPGYLVELKSRHTFTGFLVHRYEALDRDFALPDGTWVPPGDYGFNAAELRYTGPYGALTRLEGSLVAGDFYDGSIVSLSLTPFWRPSRHLRVTGTYRLDRVRFPVRDQAFDAHVAALRVQLMFDRRLSTAAFVQFNSTTDRVTANVRVRLNPGEGHDLYVVWNEIARTDRHLLDPVAPLSENRALVIKYSRTLGLTF